MDFLYIIKMTVTGALGTLGFSLLFGVKPKFVPFATFGGAISTAVYVLLDMLGVGLFFSNFIATLACVIYSIVLSRTLKTPAVIFITAAIIPLVPGGALFNTMISIISKNSVLGMQYAKDSLSVALGIAAGIAIESLIVTVINKLKIKR